MPAEKVRSRGTLSRAGSRTISNLDMFKFRGGLLADGITASEPPASPRLLYGDQEISVQLVNCIPSIVVPSNDIGISSACRRLAGGIEAGSVRRPHNHLKQARHTRRNGFAGSSK